MGKHSKDWNIEPTDPSADAKVKGEEFEEQWAQNKAAGEVKQDQDPYRRPQATNQKPSWES